MAVKTATSTFTNERYDPETYDDRDGTSLGRIHISRRFDGDLEGESTAELLTATTAHGTAVYLALDRITGRLQGRRGSFVLQHRGTVSPDGAVTAGEIVPGSATGELQGLTGTARIAVEDGEHRLLLEYDLGA